MDTFYAKSSTQGQEKETIEEHTLHVVNECKELKKKIKNETILENTWQLAETACFLHDLGKYNSKFQKKIELNLRSIDGEIPHGFLSTGFIPESIEDNNDFFPLFYSIAFHHDRSVKFSENQFINTFEKDIKGKIQNLSWLPDSGFKKIDELWYDNYYRYLDKNISQYLNLFEEKTENQRENKKKYIFLKGILHKCDYTASAGIKAELPYEGDYSRHFSEGLKKNIKDFKELTSQQIEAKELSDKNIIYIASTGAGKTEYSMNWINGDKAFYLLGLRTAVEAMYKRFKSMFAFDNEHDDNVALLHGESIYRLLEENEQDYGINDDEDILHKHSRIKLLSSPITVATADQLVTSVFKFPGFEFFYFTASYSKIVIDEIQSFSPEAIASIVVFLKEVHQLGAKFLLMTATLPPFIEEDLKDIIGKDAIVKRCHFSDIKRHVIETLQETLDDKKAEDLIAEAWRNNKKILMISNTVAGTQELAERYKDYNPQVLHARFIRKHRKEKEEAILNETKLESLKNKPALWISTQIVEASLDIDFDLLLTEYATVDALFQRFGRCWRKRNYDSKEPNIFIFKPKNKNATSRIYDNSLTESTWTILQNYSGQLITEKLKQDIIEKVFENIKARPDWNKYYRKYKEYKELLQLGLRAGSKGEAEKYFRLITNNYNVIPEPVFTENKTDIEQFLQIIEDKTISITERYKAKNELFGFTVPIQLFEKKRRELLKEIPVENVNLRKLTQKLDIWLLKGVKYSRERGAEFDKDYKDNNNFIL